MRVLLSFCTLILLAACTPKSTPVATPGDTTVSTSKAKDNKDASDKAVAKTADVQTLEGMFRIEDGRYEFIPCSATDKQYWILGAEELLTEQYDAATLQGYAGQWVVATLTGQMISSKPSRGAATSSPYDAQFQVDNVVKVRPKNTRNTCLPYEYWGSGNEPFWDIQISEAEGIIELNQLGMPTQRFDYVVPTFEEDGKLTRYYTVGTKQRVKIRIYEQTCYDDMAGNKFTHSIEVDHAGTKLKGCANKGAALAN